MGAGVWERRGYVSQQSAKFLTYPSLMTDVNKNHLPSVFVHFQNGKEERSTNYPFKYVRFVMTSRVNIYSVHTLRFYVM